MKTDERPPEVDVEDLTAAPFEDPIIYGRQWASNLLKVVPDNISYVMVPTSTHYWYLVPAGLMKRFETWLITKDVEKFPVWAFCIKAN